MRLCVFGYGVTLAGPWSGRQGTGQPQKLDTLEPGALCNSLPFPAAAGWEAPIPKIAPQIMICLLEMTSLWTALNHGHTVSLTLWPVPRKQLNPWKSRGMIHPTQGLSASCMFMLIMQSGNIIIRFSLRKFMTKGNGGNINVLTVYWDS